MKKKKQLLTAIFASTILLGTVGLSGCATSSGGGQGGYVQTALSSEEKSIYNCIIGSIDAFKDPSSVKLVRTYEKALIGRYVRVSATNSFGQRVTNTYNAYSGALHSANDVDLSDYEIDASINVSAINAKLDSYKRGQGW